ncbi:MAG: hypothetical protein NZV14_12800 [Bryobacteraceae bacterium]|nr:hypothetical protein [Bryobacteraceae bacterium]MDW8379034.1 hypothetical protein [Bryobacterales bacterium]
MWRLLPRRSLFLALAGAGVLRSSERRLRAAVAMTNITPPLGTNIAGSMRNHTAKDIHDELHARCLLLDNGRSKLAIVIVDSCALANEVVASAKKQIEQATGLAAHQTLLAATHTHSAPAAAFLFQSKPDPRYQEFLATRIADAVRLAMLRLQPAKLGWGVGREPRLLFNRRYFMRPGSIPADPFGRQTDQVLMNPGLGNPNIIKPAGPIDPEVSILGVTTDAGEPLCALGSYALHYVGVPAGIISADYFAVWASQMQSRLQAGPAFIAILANGCSGDVNNINYLGLERKYSPFERMQEVASVLAEESVRVWRQIRFQEWVDLEATLEEVELKVRKPSVQEVAEAQRLLQGAPEDLSDRRQIYAKETLQLASYPDLVRAPVQAIRIGDLGMATFPGEAFTELGLEVKRRSPFQPTFLIELAHGYYGYIPTVEAHRLGGYETWRAKSSFLEVEAAPKLVEAALRGLTKLHRRESR